MINITEIKETTIYIKCYCMKRFNEKLDYIEYFNELLFCVADILSQWSGHTYVGYPKKENEKTVFQEFFETLCNLIEFLEKNQKRILEIEKKFICSIKYNGILYRYLGYGNPTDKNKNKKIVPEYNNIFVSWSKNPENTYLESKLYGKKTKITLKIDSEAYGIDLEKFQKFLNEHLNCKYYFSRGEEREVVFPTIKKYIVEVKYD